MRPTRRNLQIYLWEWPGLVARYVWSRSPAIRLAAILAVAWTIAVAIVSGDALALWLVGLLVAAGGWGTILASRHPDAEIRRRQREDDSESPLDWAWDHLPLRVARPLQTAVGVVLVALGAITALFSLVVIVR